MQRQETSRPETPPQQLQYARRAPAPQKPARWLFYLFVLYSGFSAAIIIYFLSDESLETLDTPIDWKAHSFPCCAALFLNERFSMWFGCLLFPLYVAALAAVAYATFSRPANAALLVIALAGIAACSIDLAAQLYLNVSAPFLLEVTGSTIRIFDRVEWPAELLRIAIIYAPFLALMLIAIRRVSRHTPDPKDESLADAPSRPTRLPRRRRTA